MEPLYIKHQVSINRNTFEEDMRGAFGKPVPPSQMCEHCGYIPNTFIFTTCLVKKEVALLQRVLPTNRMIGLSEQLDYKDQINFNSESEAQSIPCTSLNK